MVVKLLVLKYSDFLNTVLVHSCRLLVECPQKGSNSMFGNSFEDTASERHAPPPTWSHFMWAFKRLRIFKPVLSPPGGKCDIGGKLLVVPWAWLSNVMPLPVFFIVACLSWTFVYFFPPQKLGYFFYSLISHSWLFLYLLIFAQHISLFTSSFPSLFCVFLPPLSSFALLIFWLFVCFPCFSLALFYLSIPPAHAFSRFILFLFVEWCMYRPTSLCSNIILRNWSKLQSLRFWTPF